MFPRQQTYDDYEPIPEPESGPGDQHPTETATPWTGPHLTAVYALIWLTYFVQGLQTGTQGALGMYVTSSFGSHSLTPALGVVSGVACGCANLTLARVLDVSGRAQGVLLCVLATSAGLAAMAASSSLLGYALAQVLCAVGSSGLQCALGVVIADSSPLRRRGLVRAFVCSPNLVTCWISPWIAARFLAGAGWPWAYAMLAVLLPIVGLPLCGLLRLRALEVGKGAVVRGPERRSFRGALSYYVFEFDVVGIVTLSAGVMLILMPFDLYALRTDGWFSPPVLVSFSAGVVCLVYFAMWERYLAPATFIPYSLLTDRTVVGAAVLASVLFFAYFCWYSFFGSFLQVVNGLDMIEANYVINIYAVGSVFVTFAAGILIYHTGRFRAVCLYGAIPSYALGTGLMICFGQSSCPIGYTIMCQVIISFAAGMIVTCNEIAILAAVAPEHIALSLATLASFNSVGGAIGSTVASVIWQQTFPTKLAGYLPAKELTNLPIIYADINTQLAYYVGSPTRLAIQKAYGDAQAHILVVATAVWALGFAAVSLWRDLKISNNSHVNVNES